MLFRSFAAYSHVFALILSSLLLLSLPDAASGAPRNVTVRFDSSQVPVSFTTGWRVAEFTGSGTVDKFAFANNPGEEIIVQLPQNVTALSYQGFRAKGGALYLVCLDCDPDVDSIPKWFTVDAHDESDDGTQPPDTLFNFTVDPTQAHILRVINLEDDRFNDTSQITFDSLILSLNDDHGVSSVSSTSSTTSAGATSVTSSRGNPTTTVPTDGSSRASTVSSSVKLQTLSTIASQPVTSGVTTVSSSNSPVTTSASSNGSSASQTQTSSNLSPASTESQTQTRSSAVGSATSSGGLQPTSSGSGSSSGTISGPGSTSSAESSTTQPSNGGVSKTVIIVVAVIASVFVLALLAAITWLLIRNQPAPRGDVEGTAGLMREAAPTAIVVSNPLPLSPMRPEIPNPFVDPLDDFSPPPRPAPPFEPAFQATGQRG
ncbi:hypothetical protein V8D89_008085 [Ganoderma adspersum]